jgi:hypothetical protein
MDEAFQACTRAFSFAFTCFTGSVSREGFDYQAQSCNRGERRWSCDHECRVRCRLKGLGLRSIYLLYGIIVISASL